VLPLIFGGRAGGFLGEGLGQGSDWPDKPTGKISATHEPARL
jgi:hypothetical protein